MKTEQERARDWERRRKEKEDVEDAALKIFLLFLFGMLVLGFLSTDGKKLLDFFAAMV